MQEIGSVVTVSVRDVWPKEDSDFTPWLRDHIGELDKALSIGLASARSEEPAGDFRIDLLAESDLGDVVIENQFGQSDHRHLGQFVTYLADRDVQLAIWIVEKGRPEHVKAVEALNERGIGKIWMVSVRAIRIGDSDPAPLFTVLAAPPDVELAETNELSASQARKRDFMAALFEQARQEHIGSPFRDLKPNVHGVLHTPARGQGLFYRFGVNKKASRVVLTNVAGRWEGAFKEFENQRPAVERAFEEDGFSNRLEWVPLNDAGRWVIRYQVEANWTDDPDPERLRELNRASAVMKRIFDPLVKGLNPELEDGLIEANN